MLDIKFLIISSTTIFDEQVPKIAELARKNRINRKRASELYCRTQWNLESLLFQSFFSTYVPEKTISVCIKDSVFIGPGCVTSGFLVATDE